MTVAPAHHGGMFTRRTALAVTVGLTTLAASGLALHAGVTGNAATPPNVGRGGAGLASGKASPTGMRPAPALVAAAPPSGADRLDVVCTVKRFCDLVEHGWSSRAGDLCSAPTVWRRRRLRALRRYTFLSARIVAASDPRMITVLVRIHVRARHGKTLHDATLHEGVNTLFFTLERVGTTAGGWLISAITTSPQSLERGPT
jgi:hypothetical protein